MIYIIPKLLVIYNLFLINLSLIFYFIFKQYNFPWTSKKGLEALGIGKLSKLSISIVQNNFIFRQMIDHGYFNLNYSPTPRCTSSKCSLLKMQPPPAINQLWHLPSPQMEQFTNMCTCLCGGRQSELSHPQHGLIPLLMDNQSPQRPCHQKAHNFWTRQGTENNFFLNRCQGKILNDRSNSKKIKYKEKSQRTFLYTPPPLPWLRNSLEEPTPELTPKFDKIPNMEQAYMTISYPWNVTPLLPCVYLRVTYWTVLGLAIHGASMSGQVSVTCKIIQSYQALQQTF